MVIHQQTLLIMDRILVVGESCTDIFHYCKIQRLSPEAPVPVMLPIRTVSNLGMSGNVVTNLKSLSSEHFIEHWFQSQEITKERYVEEKSNHMVVRIDNGEINPITPLEPLDKIKLEKLSGYDAVILSDYNKGFLTSERIEEIAKNSKFTILDSKKKLEQTNIEDITFIKLNEYEYQNNSEIVERFPEKFIITLGSKGAKYMDKTFPSPKAQETIDVSGAGDTFVASFTLKYLETKNVDESIEFANKMSSIVVGKRGVATP